MRNVMAVVGILVLAGVGAMIGQAEEKPADESLAEGQRLLKKGDYRDAFAVFRRLTLEQPAGDEVVEKAFAAGLNAIRNVGDWSETDAYRTEVVRRHSENPRVLTEAAANLRNAPHYGSIVDGGFRRGEWSDQNLTVTDADRAQSIRWLVKATRLDATANNTSRSASSTIESLKTTLLSGRYGNMVWRLQELTNLDEIPEYNDRDAHPQPGGQLGWPVDSDNEPIVYRTPASWDDAKNDGERYRWTIAELNRKGPLRSDQNIREYADFLRQHLGVGTLGNIGRFGTGDDIADDVLSLRSLKDNETVARLATGIRRLSLDDDLNFVAMYASIKNDRLRVNHLSEIYLDRQQYTQAADVLKEFTKAGTTGGSLGERYRQIVGNIGQLQNFRSQAAGEPASLQYRFRNGSRVDFVAQRVDVKALLADWQAAIAGAANNSPGPFGNLGDYLVNDRPGRPSGKKYLGETVAEWGSDLTAREGHFDKTEVVETPLREAGVYLVTAEMRDGNTSRVVVWLDDLAIVKKPLGKDNQFLYYVANAGTGTAVPNAQVDFFGWQNGDRPRQVTTRRLNPQRTNADGLVEVTLPKRFEWFAKASVAGKQLAFLNPEWAWGTGVGSRDRHRRTSAYGVTDRPIYRPEHDVQGHVWLREARYDLEDVSVYAGQKSLLTVQNPQGDDVLSNEVTLDEFGGADFQWQVPADAKLGQYSIRLSVGSRSYNGGQFRVEEYRKPDFEVTIDKPDGAVTLGKPIDVVVRASYYAGGAVSGGTVSIKVERTEYNETFYPFQPWDWLYGNGYGWKAFSGYNGHGGRRWWGGNRGTPELVLQQEMELAADGTATITIDTEMAKTLFGAKSQQYQITAEVTDVSRRVIAASGSVVAAAKPFEVAVWSQRGFVAAGENMPIQITARRIGGGDVRGKAEIQLIRLTSRTGDEVNETIVASQSVELRDGRADVSLPVANAGLYRAVAIVTETNASGKNVIERGSLEFAARGDANGELPDETLTLTSDKREYAVGETAQLLLTTSQSGANAVLFDRPESGRYFDYTTHSLANGAKLIEIPITSADMPNIYVEAIAVIDGEAETVVTELFVPPASRSLDVTVKASSADVGPGESVSLTVQAKDASGKPHAGSVAISVYDRSLDAIAGGSGPGDIRTTYWSWRRRHSVAQSDSLGRAYGEVLKPKEVRLQLLGRFGGMSDLTLELADGMVAGGGFGGGGGGRASLRMSKTRSMVESAPMPTAAPMAASAVAADESGPGLGVLNGIAQAGADASPVAVRESFADTAFWTGVAKTDADGVATVTFDMPENLTAWSANAWVVAPGTRVGHGTTGIVTSKDLLVRMIAPRFLVDTDQVVLSGVIQNQTNEDVTATVDLQADGGVLRFDDSDPRTTVVPANGTARVDWQATAIAEGEAGLTLTARSTAGDDAMRITLPVAVHGFLRTESWAGVVRNEASKRIDIVVPNDRRPEQSLLSVRVSPTVAGAIVESLPYLIEYPYGCTEQTLNRFLPAVITRKTLSDLNVSLEEVAGITAALDPNVPEREQANAPKAVLSDEKLDDVVSAGINRLLEMQLSDGGWGWFSGYQERSYPHTTAVVVRGLVRAKQSGADVPQQAIDRGLNWLDRYRTQQITYLKNHDQDLKDVRKKSSVDHLDAIVEMTLSEADRTNEEMLAYLFRDRLKLSPVGLAMVGLSLSTEPDSERFRTVVTNLEQFFVGDPENGTAYLETPNRFGYWWWYGDDVEANAYALKLFLRAMPNDPRVSGLARYLLNNRRNASYWKSTRDTAIAVESLCEYLAQSGELNADVQFEVVIDGVSQRKIAITRDNLFTFDGVVEVSGEGLASGPHTVELRRTGKGPMYYAVQSTNFTLEDFIPKAGLELKAERRYWKLTPREQSTTAAGGRGQVVGIDVEAYDRTKLAQNETVPSGTLVEVELLLESKNDYEYLIVEDRKAAGFETVEGLSGYRPGFGGAYVEFRDDRVAMFFRQMKRGTRSVTYRLRAEQPGSFSALPTKIEAMYAPSLVGNSDEQKISVGELAE